MKTVEEWMDDEDPLETRMFYELMQVYRHAERLNQVTAHQAFEDVKAFVREHCRAAPTVKEANP